MPIYEYQCNGCCECFEELVLKAEDPAPRCPQCDCADVTKLMSAGCFRPNGIPTGSGGHSTPSCRPSG